MQAGRLSSSELDNLWRDFQNPPVQYRGTPFWAWNCDMTEEKVTRILSDFQKMGMGGAYLHSRTGPGCSRQKKKTARTLSGKAGRWLVVRLLSDTGWRKSRGNRDGGRLEKLVCLFGNQWRQSLI